MSQRRGLLAVAAVTAMMLAPVATLGQSTDQSTARTPWGDPDLQRIWTSATHTPLERPANLAGREFLTEEETAELTELLTADGVDPLRGRGALASKTDAERRERTQQPKEDIHYDNAIWLTEEQPKGLSSRRTSLIVDPPDGRIPPLMPEAQQREDKRKQASRYLVFNVSQQSFDSYETRTLQQRCLVWRHEGPPMTPPVRIIPLDGRSHLPSSIRQWPGDSRGHWEGDTLVIDTINFNEKTHYQGSSEALHVVERFTRVDAETIRYEFTVEDPTSWTRPWSAELPLMKREGPLFEYACHEGNHDIANILEIARNIEKAAADAEGKDSR